MAESPSAMSTHPRSRFVSSVQQYVLAGVLTVIPIWVTWLVFRFLFGLLSKWGQPVASALSGQIAAYPALDFLIHPWFRSALAVFWVLAALYVLGWIATRVVGLRLISAFDAIIARIPLVQTIYGSTKKLVAALQQKPDRVQRVVLIEFPSPEMKAVGFVTRTFRDADTGEELAAIYVPTTPNPTSGYLEIVPLSKLVSTDWSLDDAMSFIISGGAVAPEVMRFRKSMPPTRKSP